MADHVANPPQVESPPPEEGIATAEQYMASYAHDFAEWVDGKVIPMSPVTDLHDELSAYLRMLFSAYFTLKAIGRVKQAPVVLRLETIKAYREPDLMIILNNNPGQFTDTAMIGPADICIEIVSLESTNRDYGDKFGEYEAAGVREYWIIDPIRKDAVFYRLSDEKLYQRQQLESGGSFQTPLLPSLRIDPQTLWKSPLPDILQVTEMVKEQVGKS